MQLDCELVAYDRDGRPDFEPLSKRMLHGDRSVRVTLIVFDVLAIEGLSMLSQPHAQRRALLEELDIETPSLRIVPSFDDAEALWESIVELELEGVVAKRLRSPYRLGERGWVKRKNPAWSQYESEREAAIRERQRPRRGASLTT